MNRLTEQAQRILDVALCGRDGADVTVIIQPDGRIHMLAESDWPLDSLAQRHGAQAVYRVSRDRGSVRVEGREGAKTCVLEVAAPGRIARQLLGQAPAHSDWRDQN